jgi:putative endonuclease
VTRARLLLGAQGEELAAAWYRAHGYDVLARNWRCREGEIDLVCAKARRLVVCEVKTRTSDAFGHPAEAVTVAKQRRLRILAGRWLEVAELAYRPREIRFDVAAVLAGHLEVIEGAF